MKTKEIDYKSVSGKYRVIFNHLFPLLKKISFVIVPIYFFIGIAYFGLFSRTVTEFLLQISAVLIFILGLPFSAGLRVDQLSFELGGSFSREMILIIASLVTWVNLILILGFRAWLRNRKR